MDKEDDSLRTLLGHAKQIRKALGKSARRYVEATSFAKDHKFSHITIYLRE